MRSPVQRAVDRQFNRARYDADAVSPGIWVTVLAGPQPVSTVAMRAGVTP
jgi:hypothetical protein